MEPACRRAAGGLLALHCVDLSFDLSRRRRRITRSWSLATGTELAWPGMHPPLVAPGTGPLRGTLPGDAGHLGRVRSTLPSPAWCPSLSGAWHPDRAFGRLGRGPLPLVCGSCAPDGAPHSMQERRKQGSCPPALKRGATHHPTPQSPTGTALHCYSCQDQGNNEGCQRVQNCRTSAGPSVSVNGRCIPGLSASCPAPRAVPWPRNQVVFFSEGECDSEFINIL